MISNSEIYLMLFFFFLLGAFSGVVGLASWNDYKKSKPVKRCYDYAFRARK